MDAGERYIKGRGAQVNPANRFLKSSYDKEEFEKEEDWEKFQKQKTQVLFDDSKTIVNKITSEDIPLELSVNPYQGCEHGCIYCYARNTHEYWGYSAGIDFETRIIAKPNAPDLLRKAFEKKTYTPQVVSFSMNTDCYQPVERKLQLTRKLLEVCLEYRNPCTILTKNALVLRDLDILQELNKHRLVHVSTSITAAGEDIRSVLEPRTSSIKTRLKIIEHCARLDIPTGLMFAPIIPGLNDADMFKVLKMAADAGAFWAGYTIVRLNGAIAEIFEDWLHKAFPDRAEKIWHHIQSCHGGKVNDSRWGTRMRGEGKIAEMIRGQFKIYCRKLGLNERTYPLNTAAFRRPPQNGQLELFGDY